MHDAALGRSLVTIARGAIGAELGEVRGIGSDRLGTDSEGQGDHD